MGIRVYLLLLLCCSPLVSGLAHAGAYLELRGQGLVILTGSFRSETTKFDASGRVIPLGEYKRFDLTKNLEYGLTPNLTGLLSTGVTKASLQEYDVPVDINGHITNANVSSTYSGRSVTEIGARYKLAGGQDWALSAQGTALLPMPACSCNDAVSSDTHFQTDMRLIFGKNFQFGQYYPLYTEIAAGQRLRSGSSTETHVDVTLAWHPRINWMLMGQTFSTFAPATSQALAQTSHKGQISVVYDLSTRIALQFGLMSSIYGENVYKERGLIFALWLRF